MANIVGIAKGATELLEKLVPWAAREAEEIVAKSGIPIERAIEQVADKHGQRIFQKAAPAVWTPEEKAAFGSTPSPVAGEPLPRKGDNKSLTEILGEQRSRVLPAVEENITARESSRYAEGLPVRQRAVPAVEESITAREASKYSEPVPSRQPSKSDTSASEDFEASFGELDTGIYPSEISKTGRRTLAGALGAAGATGIGSELYRREYEKTLTPSFADAPEAEGIGPVADPEKYAKSLESLSTPDVKKEVKTLKNALDTTLDEVDAAEEAGEIPAKAAQAVRSERDRAYDLYEQAKSRNEWLELAQILAQAVTQYGAARVGLRTGRSMAGLQIPGVDYGARTEREQRLLETRLRDIGEREKAEERAKEREEERGYKERELDIRERALTARGAQDPYARMEASEALKQQREITTSLKDRLSAAEMVLSAQNTLARENVSSKQKQKAEEQIQKYAGPAGIDMLAIEEASTEPGALFGTNISEQKKATNIAQVVKQLKEQLDQIQQRPRKVKQEAGQAATTPATMQQSGGPRMITVTHKASGQSRQYPAGSPEVIRAQEDPDFEVR